MILHSIDPPIATLSLNDPQKRNALSIPMFDALDRALESLVGNDAVTVVVVRGEGAAFCAGFDLAAAVQEPGLLPLFIRRLSSVNRRLRRLPQVAVAAVHGAAIAGGCALLSACDFAVVEAQARIGYPVHALGISPAVTIPLLRLAMGDGPARALLMSGALIDGREAHRRGLATHVASSCGEVHIAADALARMLAHKPPHALRITKGWLNVLDGSLEDSSCDAAAEHSAAAADSSETRSMLHAFWSTRP